MNSVALPLMIVVVSAFVAGSFYNILGIPNSNESSRQTLTVLGNLNDGISNTGNMKSGAKCLTFDDSFDALVAASSNVYITMPSKAAGSTMNKFTRYCCGNYDTVRHNSVWLFENGGLEDREKFFMETYELPKIVATHVLTDNPMVNLMEQATRDSLIIYSYREETSRIISAVEQILESFVCIGRDSSIPIEKPDDKHCIVGEESIVKKVLEPKRGELAGGTAEVLTHRLFDAIENNFPRMVFVHYKQVDRLQKVLAKYFCPSVEPLHKNIEEQKAMNVSIRLSKNGEVVPMKDWLDAKRDKIEWTFSFKGGDHAQAKVRTLEDELFLCQDELLQVTRETSF